jgi:hypothetical protein
MTLKIEVTCSSEMSDDFQWTRGCTSEDLNLHNLHPCSSFLADMYSLSILALLATCCTLISCFAYFSTLKMGATFSTKTSVDFQRTSWRYIQEDRNLRKSIELN